MLDKIHSTVDNIKVGQPAVACSEEIAGAGARVSSGRTPLVKLTVSAVTLAMVMPAAAALYVMRYTAPAVSSDTNTDPSGSGSTSAGRPAKTQHA